MNEKTINFDNKNINKSTFYKTKRLFKIDDINIDKIYIKILNPMQFHSNILLLMKTVTILVLYV